jgi:hypothetical protein
MTAQAFANKYAQLLDKQGNYVVTVEGVDWYEYSGFMIPAYLPHCVPNISFEMAEKVLKTSGKPFVRWDSNFGHVNNLEWWYILRKGTWHIEDVPDKKKRWMIKQGIKNFTTRLLTYDEVIKFCSEVALKAAKRYQVKSIIETEDILVKRTNAAKKVPGVLEYIGCFEGEKLVSFSENYIQDNAVWLAIIRHDPEYLKKYSSYVLVSEMLSHYLNERKLTYVLDGCRSIYHRSRVQDYLMGVFGFTKEYAILNVVYSPKFAMAVKAAYPFRNVVWSLSSKWANSTLDKVGAVLRQEYIRKTCESRSPW